MRIWTRGGTASISLPSLVGCQQKEASLGKLILKDVQRDTMPDCTSGDQFSISKMLLT